VPCSHCAAQSKIEVTNQEGIVTLDAPAKISGSDTWIDKFALALSLVEIDFDFAMIKSVTTVALLADAIRFLQYSFDAQLIAGRGRVGTWARWLVDETTGCGRPPT
jgi:hypothetical protein